MQERRLCPRYFFATRLQVWGGSGDPLQAHTTEISLGGIGFVMQHSAVVALAQGGAILTIGDRLQIALDAGAAGGGGLRLPGSVRGVRRVSRDEYRVAVTFDEVTPSQELVLTALVEHARETHLRS